MWSREIVPSRRRRQSLAVAFGGTVVLLAAVAAVGPVAVGLLRPPAPVEVQVFVTEDGANDAPVDADRSEMGTGGTGRFGGGADPDSDGDQTGVDGAEPGGTATSTRQAGRSPRVVGPTVDRPQDPAGPGASAPVVAGGVLPGAVPAPTVVSRPLPDDNPPVPSDSSPVPAPTVPIIPSTEPPGPADPAPAPTTGPGPTTAPTTRPPTTAPTTRPPTTVPPPTPTPTPTPSTRPPSTATPPTPPTTEVTPAPSVTSPAADPGGPITAR